MNVILFGASGMVGTGALRECLVSDQVEKVLAVVRKPTGTSHAKLTELVHGDFTDFASAADALTGYDACFWCLGATSAGMNEAEYTRLTYEFTIAAARVLSERNPGMTFVFVSGASADSSEKGRMMWARVKGRAENAVLKMPFKASFVLRPALILSKHGAVSRTPSYRVLYKILSPLLGMLEGHFPKYVTTTETIGKAMLVLATRGGPKPLLECADVNAL